MKKIITMILALAMVLSLAACGGSKKVTLKILDTEYVTEDYAIAVGKENTELMTKIETALTELIADGTVASIIAKYIPAE